MTQMTETTYARTLPAVQGGAVLRGVGALALLAMGAVHLHEYFAEYYRVVPTIGPLFALNFAGAVVLALLLLQPWRNRVVDGLAAVGGVGMAVVSIAFLLVSEHRPLFGFAEYGYRPAIVVALVSEAVAAVCLAGFLTTLRR
jgi:hypothetical protein